MTPPNINPRPLLSLEEALQRLVAGAQPRRIAQSAIEFPKREDLYIRA